MSEGPYGNIKSVRWDLAIGRLIDRYFRPKISCHDRKVPPIDGPTVPIDFLHCPRPHIDVAGAWHYTASIEMGGKVCPFASPIVSDVIACREGRVLSFAFFFGMGHDLKQAYVHLLLVQPPGRRRPPGARVGPAPHD